MFCLWEGYIATQIQLEKELQDNVSEALSTIAQYGDWAESHGRLHEKSLSALALAQVPKLFLPTSLGGLAVSPLQCALVCEQIAHQDSAAAWYVMVYNAARLMAAKWSCETVEMLWLDNPNRLVAASGHTPLTCEADGDQYVISGRNSFVSGVHHAEFVMSPMRLNGELGTVIVPVAECEIVDNWDTLGMRGTGSNDIVVHGARVHKAQVNTAQEMAQQINNKHYQDKLYQCPARVVFATYVPVALSLAERALTQLKDLALNKVPFTSDSKLATRALAQQHYAKGLAAWRSARIYFYDALQEVWDKADPGYQFSDQEKADLYLAGTHAIQTSALAVKHVVDAAGSSSLRKGTPLERILRDMEVLRHHGFANESRYASVAQVHFGVALDYPLLLR